MKPHPSALDPSETRAGKAVSPKQTARNPRMMPASGTVTATVSVSSAERGGEIREDFGRAIQENGEVAVIG